MKNCAPSENFQHKLHHHCFYLCQSCSRAQILVNPTSCSVAKPNPISPKRFANPTLYFGIPFRGLAYISTTISTLSLAFTTCNALSYVRINSVYDPAYLKNLLTYVTISGSNAVPSFLLHFVTSTMSPTASLR